MGCKDTLKTATFLLGLHACFYKNVAIVWVTPFRARGLSGFRDLGFVT